MCGEAMIRVRHIAIASVLSLLQVDERKKAREDRRLGLNPLRTECPVVRPLGPLMPSNIFVERYITRSDYWHGEPVIDA